MRPGVAIVILCSAWLAFVAAAAEAEGGGDTPAAEMLLELDVLADESFASRPQGPLQEETARSADVLERLDWLDSPDDALERENPVNARRRR